jgi:RimJ/RimL family protein N-acetyltransferase
MYALITLLSCIIASGIHAMDIEHKKEPRIDSITFEKASRAHEREVFHWFTNQHVQEFWDNSQEHKDDILIFMDGRIDKSPYFDGMFDYWVGLINHEPFALIMTSQVLPTQDLNSEWLSYISKTGKTFSIDFMIGNENYMGKGLAAPTLKQFMTFFSTNIEKSTDTFIIDPVEDNNKAQHVYEKAGFKKVCRFKRRNELFWLMVQKI